MEPLTKWEKKMKHSLVKVAQGLIYLRHTRTTKQLILERVKGRSGKVEFTPAYGGEKQKVYIQQEPRIGYIIKSSRIYHVFLYPRGWVITKSMYRDIKDALISEETFAEWLKKKRAEVGIRTWENR
jgi:hypothetical protein